MFRVAGLAALSLAAFTASVDAAPLERPTVNQIAKRTLQNRNVDLNVTTWKPTAQVASRTPAKSSHSMSLKKLKTNRANPRSAAYLKGLTGRSSSSTTSGSGELISLFEGEEFATSITFGTQSFDVIVDTGSSDTWVVKSGFECIDLDTGKKTSQSTCDFGTAYTVDSTLKTISGEEFEIEYGDGEYLYGYMATETVTLADITVDQEVAVVTEAAWEGDGTTSGLTGLAYPALTSAYSERTEQQEEYNPIFTTMYEDGLVDSYFSLAILRDVSGDAGYLTLGGLPPIDFNETFTTTDILVTSIEGYSDSYDFYTINIDSMSINGKAISGSGGSDIQYIVDSGTTLNYYPTSVADAVNAAFDPAAVYSDDEGAYVVDCDATAPTHTITIGGTAFTINPLDMILYAGTDDDGNAVCISGIDDGGDDSSEDLYILGDTFQKNVVTVFDVGAVEMKFAPHVDYTSNDTY
ncbi:acid protease [Penicillium longicatenatum]|uniref:acid protease n=1 Tax=Penicillium longicatenatum TaxID=1561947 RepID=UPI0025491182|nr:acid protease [Penicillium longicatenatum]KAJ5630926.1 acid protease [Penicillium longicatenatum]